MKKTLAIEMVVAAGLLAIGVVSSIEFTAIQVSATSMMSGNQTGDRNMTSRNMTSQSTLASAIKHLTTAIKDLKAGNTTGEMIENLLVNIHLMMNTSMMAPGCGPGTDNSTCGQNQKQPPGAAQMQQCPDGSRIPIDQTCPPQQSNPSPPPEQPSPQQPSGNGGNGGNSTG